MRCGRRARVRDADLGLSSSDSRTLSWTSHAKALELRVRRRRRTRVARPANEPLRRRGCGCCSARLDPDALVDDAEAAGASTSGTAAVAVLVLNCRRALIPIARSSGRRPRTTLAVTTSLGKRAEPAVGTLTCARGALPSRSGDSDRHDDGGDAAAVWRTGVARAGVLADEDKGDDESALGAGDEGPSLARLAWTRVLPVAEPGLAPAPPDAPLAARLRLRLPRASGGGDPGSPPAMLAVRLRLRL